MKKDFIQNGQALYAAPDCHPFAFAPEGVLCGSGTSDEYGDEGYAGANGYYHDLGDEY